MTKNVFDNFNLFQKLDIRTSSSAGSLRSSGTSERDHQSGQDGDSEIETETLSWVLTSQEDGEGEYNISSIIWIELCSVESGAALSPNLYYLKTPM